MADVLIGTIKLPKKRRTNLGDLDKLAASMKDRGLLQNIVLRSDHTLVAGYRRLEAAKQLGWTRIRAHVSESFDAALKYLKAQRDENTCREPMPPDLAVEIGQDIEKEAAKEAKAAQKAAGGDRKSEKARQKSLRQKKPNRSKQDESKRTTAIAAAAVGMSRTSYEQAKAVMDSGNETAIEGMRTTGKVGPAFKIVVPPVSTEWKSKSVQRATLEKLADSVDEIAAIAGKSTMEVSVADLRRKVKALRDQVQRILKGK